MTRSPRYPADVLAVAPKKRPAPVQVVLRTGLVLTDRPSRFTGTVVDYQSGVVVLEAPDDGGRRAFPFEPDRFAVDGKPVRVTKGVGSATRPARTTSASGAVVPAGGGAKVARASRIWVEGLHDAQLLEKVWGAELRDLAIVVEPLDGADDLIAQVRAFAPGPGRRLGVLMDHLVPHSKETRLAQQVTAEGYGPHLLVTGHPFVDVWAAVRPSVIGIDEWPEIPKGRPWKAGVAAALGVADPSDVWRRALAGVESFADLETPLVGAVERLLDFLTQAEEAG